MSENLVIQHLSKFNSRDSRHREIRENNNAIMLHKIHKYLKSRTDLNFAVDKKEFAYWMTALGMNESSSFTKESGINNFFGITATEKQIEDTKKMMNTMDGREVEFFPPAKLVATHEVGVVEGQGNTGEQASQNRYFANYKTEKEGMDAFFNDVIFPNFPNVMKAKNSTEFVLALMKGKDNKMYATDFKFRKNMPRQSALPPVLEDTGELEPNIFSNQYWLKFHNFLGGVTRPDMETIKIGDNELIVPSEKGKRGINHSPRGIKGGQYINTDLFAQLEADPDLPKKVVMQKENVNNNVNPKYAKDYTSLDFVHRNVTKEQFLRNSIAGNIGTGNLSFQEIIQDIYKLDGEIGFESKDFEIGTKADTIVDSTGENLTDLNFEFFGRTDGFELYGGQRQGKTFFGGKLNKEITPGVRIKGGIEQEDNLKRGNIGLEVDLK